MNNLCRSASLETWQETRMRSVHCGKTDYSLGRKDVALLAYHFWDVSEYEKNWTYLECAIRETWMHCGMLKTILVTNRAGCCAVKFAETFPCVDIQVEPSLHPGDIFTMSSDCNGKLTTRFTTEYVLIVQNDGFPLRTGLDEFIGKYDFVGAPYVRPRIVPQILARLSGCWAMNGGFSLRSHELCDFAAYFWNRKYNNLGDCKAASEDIFYTQTLPLREPSFRRRFRLPTTRKALAFSWDTIVPIQMPAALPFGFHRDDSFACLASFLKV